MSNTVDKAKTKIGIAAVIVGAIALIAVSLVAGYFIKSWVDEKNKPEITSTGISEKIQEISELASAELTYNGLVRFTEGEIPYIDLKGFTMIYRADVKAGVDVSNVNVDLQEGRVIINMPQVEVLSVNVDPDSIEFYDTMYALFNWSKKEDVVDALKAAQEDVMAHADIEGLKERAKTGAESVIKSLLRESVGDMEIVFNYR